MRKGLWLAAGVAVAAAGYYFWQPHLSIPNQQLLASVPADTAILSAQLEPIDLQQYLSAMGLASPQMQAQKDWQALAAQATTSGEHFVFSLATDWHDMLHDPNALTQTLGIKPQLRSLFYLVGLSPVLKLELSDDAAFWRYLDALASKAGVQVEQAEQDGQPYRRYLLDFADIQLELLARVQDHWLTLAVTADKLASQRLSELLGTQPLPDNLAQSAALLDSVNKFKLAPSSFGYVDWHQWSQPLVSQDSSRLAKDIELLFAAQAAVAMSDWRNAACQQDLAEITKQWPGVFWSNQLTANGMQSRAILPIGHATTRQALQQLQGYVPAWALDEQIIARIGVGIDVGQLSAVAGKLWGELTRAKWQCAPLQTMQQRWQQNNPTMPLMMAGMLNGVQGVSLTLNELHWDASTQMPTDLDLLVTIDGNHLNALLSTAKSWRPELAAIALPKSGEVLDLTAQIPQLQVLNIPLKLMADDQHLQLFSGEKALQQAQQVRVEKVSQSALLGMTLNYPRLAAVAETVMIANGQPVPAEVTQLKDKPLHIILRAEVTDLGLEFSSTMQQNSQSTATKQ